MIVLLFMNNVIIREGVLNYVESILVFQHNYKDLKYFLMKFHKIWQ